MIWFHQVEGFIFKVVCWNQHSYSCQTSDKISWIEILFLNWKR